MEYSADCLRAALQGGDDTQEETGFLLMAEFLAMFRALIKGLSK